MPIAVILFFYNHRFSNNNRLSPLHTSELLRTSHGTQSHSFTPPISAPIYHRPPCRTPPHPIYYTAPPHIPHRPIPYTTPPYPIYHTAQPHTPHRPTLYTIPPHPIHHTTAPHIPHRPTAYSILPPPISAPTAPQQKTLFITFWRPMRQTDLIIVCNGLRKNFSFFCVKNRFLAKGRGGTPRLRPFAVAVFYFRTMRFMRFRA